MSWPDPHVNSLGYLVLFSLFISFFDILVILQSLTLVLLCMDEKEDSSLCFDFKFSTLIFQNSNFKSNFGIKASDT